MHAVHSRIVPGLCPDCASGRTPGEWSAQGLDAGGACLDDVACRVARRVEHPSCNVHVERRLTVASSPWAGNRCSKVDYCMGQYEIIPLLTLWGSPSGRVSYCHIGAVINQSILVLVPQGARCIAPCGPLWPVERNPWPVIDALWLTIVALIDPSAVQELHLQLASWTTALDSAGGGEPSD